MRAHHRQGAADMTQGPMLGLVVRFALPLVAGNILQQLYNMVDTLVIGNFCGSVSLAAVGTSSQPVELLINLFMGIGSGVSILISQAEGARDEEGIRRLTRAATSFLYMVSVPVMILGWILSPWVLRLMQVPDNTFDLALSYVRFVYLGTLGNLGYNMNAGILRGIGDSMAPLWFLLISCAVNIVLDLVFVAGLGMDTAGAAVATSIAMMVSWLFSIGYASRRHARIGISGVPRSYDRRVMQRIIRIGLPLGLNNSLYSVGHLVMQSIINLQGSDFMAACSIATKLTGIANVTITAIAQAGMTFAGQNYGARNYRRVLRGGLRIPFFSSLVNLVLDIIATILCPLFLAVFTRDAAVLALAERYIYVVMPSYAAYTMFSSMINYANGLGNVRYPTMVNLLMLWAVRLPSAFLIAFLIGGTWCMGAFPISFVFGMVMMLFYYKSRSWKKIKALAAAQQDELQTVSR